MISDLAICSNIFEVQFCNLTVVKECSLNSSGVKKNQ